MSALPTDVLRATRANRIANGIDDRTRAVRAMEGIVGKRITYARPDINA